MPVIQKQFILAAGDVVENVFAGSAFEFLRSNAIVSIGALQSAANADVFFSLSSGSDIIVEESTMSDANRYPIIPDDFAYTDVGVAGDRLVMRIRNASGVSVTTRVIAQITNL